MPGGRGGGGVLGQKALMPGEISQKVLMPDKNIILATCVIRMREVINEVVQILGKSSQNM